MTKFLKFNCFKVIIYYNFEKFEPVEVKKWPKAENRDFLVFYKNGNTLKPFYSGHQFWEPIANFLLKSTHRYSGSQVAQKREILINRFK